MPSNLTEFNAALDKVAKELPQEQIQILQRAIAIEALSRVVLKTPVDFGTARGAWYLTIGEAPEGVANPNETTVSRSAQQVIDRGMANLAQLEPFGIVYIGNIAPHIEVLEYGLFEPENPGPSSDPRPSRRGQILVIDGFSKQAPRGMLGVTLEELSTIFG